MLPHGRHQRISRETALPLGETNDKLRGTNMDYAIFNSIHDNYSPNLAFEDFIKRYHIENYSNLLCDSDETRRILFLKKQERLYHVFAEVSKIICDVAEDNNISIAFVKGIFIEKKYYNDRFIRKISDIDLLVKWKDLHNLVLECRKKGLFTSYSVKYLDDISSHSKPFDHHIALKTEFVFSGKIYSFEVEFHFRLFAPPVHELYYSHDRIIDEVLREREYVNIDGYTFPILSFNYDFIFVMAHAVKHFIWDISRSNKSVDYFISLSNFYDVHLMLKSCDATKQLNEIIRTTCQWSLCDELFLSIYINSTLFCSCEYELGELYKMIDNNPCSRWAAFLSHFILTAHPTYELLFPVSNIAKYAIIAFNQKPKLSETEVLEYVCENGESCEVSVSNLGSKTIITCPCVEHIILRLIILRNYDSKGYYDIFKVNNNSLLCENSVPIKNKDFKIRDNKLELTLNHNALHIYCYNNRVYYRIEIENTKDNLAYKNKGCTKFNFHCLEMISDEQNL